MEAAKDVFETWYSANYDAQESEDKTKVLFKEAFEAGMVSGMVFLQTQFISLVNVVIDDYEGFDDEK